MEHYRAMYTHLFNAVTDVIEVLQEAQKECEALFLECDALEAMGEALLKDEGPAVQADGKDSKKSD